MSDTAFPPAGTDDKKQALRLRRFRLGALGYAVGGAMLAVAWALGVLTATSALAAVAAFVAVNLAFYAAIRSGFNLRFADPSLTLYQVLVAITAVMAIVFRMDEGRSIALFCCFLIALFGVFRLSVREFVLVVLYTTAAHALAINALMHLRPQAISSIQIEWLSWLGLAVLLPCFALIGVQISSFRRRLNESEARFKDLTEMSSDFYWESDAQHRVTIRNFMDAKSQVRPAFKRGVQPDERRWDAPYLWPDAAGWRAHEVVLDAHEPFRGFVFSRMGRDGLERHFSVSGNPLFEESGAFKGYRGVGTDVTELKQAERALRESADNLRVFADNVPAMTTYWDAQMRCLFANKLYLQFWGLTVENVIGRHIREIQGEAVYLEVEAHRAQAMLGESVTYQRKRILPNGDQRHLEVRLVPRMGDASKAIGFFAVTTDITEHKRAEERIQRVAHHDSLTGLPNRLLFNDRLDQAIALCKRQARTFALLYLDLDRFKPVNDLLGHAAGDQLLQIVATRIRREVRESDTVARIGGDEFTVILADVAGRQQAQGVARKITTALEAPFYLDNVKGPVRIGSSIGIAAYPDDAQDADGLVRVADGAMYVQKGVPAAEPTLQPKAARSFS